MTTLPASSDSYRSDRGFTLIEVVVAMAILAVISVMGWQAVDLVLKTNSRSQEGMVEDLTLQAAWQLIGTDLIHLRARPYHDGLGGIEPAYETGTGQLVLRLSRGGGAGTALNPAGLTRVSYLLESGELYRESLPAHLSPREAEPVRRLLLADVQELRFEQPDWDNYFGPRWPPLNEERGIDSLPAMVRVTLVRSDGQVTRQLFPGVSHVAH